MAQEIREFAVTVPAGTPLATPAVTSIAFPERQVRAISYRVPPGPSGLMGWRLTSAGAAVIPIQPNTYIVTDNQADKWQLEGYLDSGNWAVTAYNTGIYPHTVYLTFELDLIGTDAAPTPPPADVGTGVIGTGGTVTPPPAPVAGPVLSATGPTDDTGPVISVLVALMAAQLAAAGG